MPSVYVEFIDISDCTVTIEGFFFSDDSESSIVVRMNDIVVSSRSFDRVHINNDVHSDLRSGHARGFKADFQLDDVISGVATFHISTDTPPLPIVCLRFSRLSGHIASYRTLGTRLIVKNGDDKLEFHKYSRSRHLIRETFFISCELVSNLRIKECLTTIKREIDRNNIFSVLIAKSLLTPLKEFVYNIGIITIRILYYACKVIIGRKEIWIISDRIDAAGDNGEALFRYIAAHHKSDKKLVYFAISKKSPDYDRMKQAGRVVSRYGILYKLLFLLSDKVISSHANDFVINAFPYRLRDVVDLYGFDFIFLQHGVTKGDISNWLNRYNKNIKIFVTAAYPEYESIINGDYAYDKEVVKLTGFPRHDLLENKPVNKLVIAPTWRRGLVPEVDQATGVRPYSKTFIQSEYYKFYQEIIDSSELQKTLKDYNMTAEFYLHPSFASQVSDFKDSDLIVVKSLPYDYKTAFSEGSVMITDYSSVEFDFAYLKKPIIYAQFDRNEFYKQHLYTSGYYSYEDDGFGPVGYDIASVIQYTKEVVASGCTMSRKYENRVEKFFYEFDNSSSERVYREISHVHTLFRV